MTLAGTVHGVPVDAAAIGRHARAVREAMNVYLTQEDLADFKNAGRR